MPAPEQCEQPNEEEDVTSKSMGRALLLQHVGLWELNPAWPLIEFYSNTLQESSER